MSSIMAMIHYDGVIIGEIASQITSLTIVCSTVYSDADQRKHQSSASLAFAWGIHRGPVNSPHKWAVTRKNFHLMTSSCKSNFWSTRTLWTLCYQKDQKNIFIVGIVHNIDSGSQCVLSSSYVSDVNKSIYDKSWPPIPYFWQVHQRNSHLLYVNVLDRYRISPKILMEHG